MNYDWLSAHVHFRGGLYQSACDRVILDVIEPFVRICQRKGWISKYFFVRYGNTGPHVRLRLHGKDSQLRKNVKPELRNHVRNRIPSELRSETDESSDNLITWVPYERETNRYGGQEGVRLAEEFFRCSSEACFALLDSCREQGRAARLGKGLLTMVVLVNVFSQTRREAAELVEGYAGGYVLSVSDNEEQEALLHSAFENGYSQQNETLSKYVKETWSRLRNGNSLSDSLDVYHSTLARIAGQFETLLDDSLLCKDDVVPDSWNQAVRLIVPSYLHMNNNRLGILPSEEAYLAHLILKSLSLGET